MTAKVISRTFGILLSASFAAAVYTAVWHIDWVIAGPPKAFAQKNVNDKYDGDCTGNETIGRCADKCTGAAATQCGDVTAAKQQPAQIGEVLPIVRTGK